VIESYLDQDSDNLPRPTGVEVGSISDYFEGGQKYLSYIKSTIDTDFEGLKIGIDGAHGSTYHLGPYLFGDLEADTVTVGSNPDGTNINAEVGSTHPERLQELVKDEECDFGLAFDGDGARIIAVDEKGEIVEVDKIMFILAQDMKENGLLKHDTAVSTVMSNPGNYKANEADGMRSDKTKAGDRYGVAEIEAHGYNMGGVQSGYIVM